MKAAKCLVGTDIELMPSDILTGQHNPNWWEAWVAQLQTIPPKGERLQIGNNMWCHRDGLSLEYGIHPATTVDQFLSAVHRGKEAVESVINMELIAVDYFNIQSISYNPALEDYFEMGCSPDNQVIIGEGGEAIGYNERTIPDEARNENTRECGGHIHISLPTSFVRDGELCTQFVKALDDLVYPLATMCLGDYRSWYRHRNLFRFTPYGVEYRSLGATALLSQDAGVLMTHVFDLAKSVWEV